mmetsp:Transcript_23464/g.21337  ORF Transcript_23464/g.21337 Transcript_23464/m.21337 type:complete len:281 (-) Transcript_23464:24-866(-)
MTSNTFLLFFIILLNVTCFSLSSFVKGPSRAMRSYNKGSQVTTFDQYNEKKRVDSSRLTMTLQTTKSIKKSPKIIIAGAPAAGKGTQCEIITQSFGVIHLSTGDILRAAVKQGTDLGIKAKAFMDAGQLVPDDLIIDVICDRLKQQDCIESGWLLDGFPRTRAQAEALSSAGLIPDSFLLLDVPEDILVERVTGRRTDPVTGKIYHLKFSPPNDQEVISRLVQRSDDTAEKIVVRYREFQSHIDSVRSFYEDKIIAVDGSKPKNDVSQLIISALSAELSE